MRAKHVIVEIRKGMYGLPQAIVLSNVQLRNHLKNMDTSKHKPKGVYKQKIRQISFTLDINGFGICYKNKKICNI